MHIKNAILWVSKVNNPSRENHVFICLQLRGVLYSLLIFMVPTTCIRLDAQPHKLGVTTTIVSAYLWVSCYEHLVTVSFPTLHLPLLH